MAATSRAWRAPAALRIDEVAVPGTQGLLGVADTASRLPAGIACLRLPIPDASITS